MPKGISIHVGLNTVSSSYYGSGVRDLYPCENDAVNYWEICREKGFSEQHLLLSKSATLANFESVFAGCISGLEEDDLLVFTFSGHGSRKKDLNGDEEDDWDETLCFYDGEFLDDQFQGYYEMIPKGARVLFIIDSCYSGTSFRDWIKDFLEEKGIKKDYSHFGLRVYASSMDHETSTAGYPNSLYTNKFLAAYLSANGELSYEDLHAQLIGEFPIDQTPQFFDLGDSSRWQNLETTFNI